MTDKEFDHELDRMTAELIAKMNQAFRPVVDDLVKTSAYIKHRLDMNESRLNGLEQRVK